MTVELTIDDLRQLEEGAQKHGTCVLVAKSTEGEPVWLTISHRRQRQRNGRPAAAPAPIETQ